MSMGFLVAASSRKRDDRGRYMEGDDRRMGNDHSTHYGQPQGNYAMDAPEMRRRRDSRGRYMEGEDPRMAYEGSQSAWRPWPEPNIPPYLDGPEGNDRPGRERRDDGRMEHEPYMMRDRNVVNIRDYQDKRRIGFGENRMHDGRRHQRDRMEDDRQGDAHRMGAYPMHDHLTHEVAAEWVEDMQNADPDLPRGPKWQMDLIKPLANKHGFTTPDKQIEFWAVMNMMYSDYCETAKKHGVSTMDFYADMAKAWMKDKDAVDNKTLAYIECCTK